MVVMKSNVCLLLDQNLKDKLIASGLMVLKEDENKTVFVFDKMKFNSKGVDNSKFIITDRLTF